ncbi:MAG TPA: tetratricopeptide repeat-containing serine/threonine-protein kinase [Candidatus Polarisedimenticolaceae bacterium]
MPAESPPHDEHTGRRIGAYDVLELLGRGGMGEVYRGWDTKLRREVALKALPTELLADDRARARFLRETRLACRVVHPYVATVFDVVEDEDRPWIVMERIEGRRLDHFLADDAPALAEVARLGLEVAEALQAIHGSGLVHRDLKPGNVMVTTAGHVKVMDFGVAYPLRVLEPPGGDTASGSTEPSLTGEGYGVGTVAYMSPEQVRGAEVDPRSDLFSLGILLYEAITGEHPFQRESIWATASAIVNDPPGTGPEPRTLTESGPLRRVVIQLLEKDPARRPQSSDEVVRQLRAIVRGEPLPVPSEEAAPAGVRRAVIAAVVVVAAAFVVYRLWTGTPPATGRPTVAVLPFEDRTGEAGETDRGDMLADLLAADLGRGAVRAVGRERLQPALAGIGASGAGVFPEVGRLTGAAWIVTGQLYREGASYHAAYAVRRTGASSSSASFKASAGSVTALADLMRPKILETIAPDATRAQREARAWPARDDASALLEQRARRAMRELRFLDAIDHAVRALELEPDYLPAALVHARALDAAGFGKRALAAAERALRIARRPGAAPGSVWSMEAAAVDARIRDRLSEAVELRRGLAEGASDDPEAWLELASTLRAAGKLDEATAAAEKAEALDPRDARVFIVRAKVAVAQGKFPEAQARLDKAEALFAEVGSAEGAASVAYERGSLERGRSDQQAAKLRYEDAERRYREAEFEGGVARAQAAGAMAAIFLGRFAEAAPLCETASRSARARGDFRLAIEVRGAVGAALYARGDTSGAERYLREAVSDASALENDALRLNPLVNLAGLLAGTGRAGEGALLASDVLALARSRGRKDLECVARTLLADAAYQMGRLGEAIEEYEAAELIAAGGGVSPDQRFGVLEYLTEALDWTCDSGRALDTNRRALEVAAAGDQRMLRAYGLLRRAELRGGIGDFEGADLDLTETEGLIGSEGDELLDMKPRVQLARATLEVYAGSLGRAQSPLGKIVAEGESTGAHGVEMAARLTTALAALERGDPRSAVRQAERVLGSKRATVPERARARSLLARSLASARQFERAAAEARAALDEGAAIGIPLVVAESSAVLVSLPPAARPAGVGALREDGLRALATCESAVPEARRGDYRRRADLEMLFSVLRGS